jgi:tyrosine-protein kinase Etk/Wzc
MSNRDERFSDLDEFTFNIPGLTLDVITRGSLPNNPSELLGSPTMKELLNHVAQQYDFVIVDSAPSLSLSDSLILSRHVAGVLLVVSAKGTQRRHVKLLVSRFSDVNANIIGFALNKITQRNADYYGYLYGNTQDSSVKTKNKNWRRWRGEKDKQKTKKYLKTNRGATPLNHN